MKMKGTEFDLTDLAENIADTYKDEISDAADTNTANLVKTILSKVPVVLGDALVTFGGRVEWHGMGSFHLDKTEAGIGRNFTTGEPVEYPEGLKVKFRTAKALKALITERTGKPTK